MSIGKLDNLINTLAKLPSLGPRSARRIALHLVQQTDKMEQLVGQMQEVVQEVSTCKVCGNIDLVNPCSICQDPKRDNTILCVVATVADLWAIEKANFFKGKYHVTGGTISALDGRTPDKLNLASILERVKTEGISEIIVAMNFSLEGQATSHYITDLLHGTDVKITRLAHGIPMGAELDYMDEGTLTLAIRTRQGV